MLRIFSLLFMIFLILMVVASGCAPQVPPAPVVENNQEIETYTVSLGHEPPAAMTDWAKKFKELAEQKLPGQLEIVVYPEVFNPTLTVVTKGWYSGF